MKLCISAVVERKQISIDRTICKKKILDALNLQRSCGVYQSIFHPLRWKCVFIEATSQATVISWESPCIGEPSVCLL